MSATEPAAAAAAAAALFGLKPGEAVPPPPGLEDVVPAGHKPHARDDAASQCSTDCGADAALTVRGRGAPGHALQAATAAPAEPRAAVLSLAGAVDFGTPGLPSVGSACHHLGLCKPCDFLHRSSEGCKAGASCKFCHLCGPDENKKRKAMKKSAIRAVRQWQHSQLHQAAEARRP